MPVRGLAPSTVGQRTRLVTIEQMTESTGASGRPVETWTLLGQAWMERQERLDRTGGETFRAEGLSATTETLWLLPYQANMDPELLNVPKLRRLTLSGRVYDITSAQPIGVHHQIALRTIAKD